MCPRSKGNKIVGEKNKSKSCFDSKRDSPISVGLLSCFCLEIVCVFDDSQLTNIVYKFMLSFMIIMIPKGPDQISNSEMKFSFSSSLEKKRKKEKKFKLWILWKLSQRKITLRIFPIQNSVLEASQKKKEKKKEPSIILPSFQTSLSKRSFLDSGRNDWIATENLTDSSGGGLVWLNFSILSSCPAPRRRISDNSRKESLQFRFCWDRS